MRDKIQTTFQSGNLPDETTQKSLSHEKPVWGAKAISRLLDQTPRQTYHLLESGAIKSAVRKGRKWAVLPSKLRAEFGGQ